MGFLLSSFRRTASIALLRLAAGSLCLAQDPLAGATAAPGPGSPADLSSPSAAKSSAISRSPAAAHEASLLAFELGAGPLLGLDRPLRGAELSATLLLDLGAAFGPGFSGLAQGVEAAALYDMSFQATILCADIVFYLGPEIRLLAGFETPLGPAAIDADGTSLALEPGPWPNRFAVSALLGRLGGSEPSRETARGSGTARRPPERRPRFSIEAEFGWSSYRLADQTSATRLQTARSGIRGFAAGFRLDTVLRLRWGAFR
ncbi:MAG: hypothetical protein ACLQMF_18475 [Rectinemataceae bacterium]